VSPGNPEEQDTAAVRKSHLPDVGRHDIVSTDRGANPDNGIDPDLVGEIVPESEP
jgi:hypothetical protein